MDPAATAGVFDRAAATYDVAAFPFFTRFGEALVEFAQIAPHEHVLDVGCGAGAALKPALARAASATGVDRSAWMAERARAAAPGADVRIGDASALEFERNSFDVVVSGFVVFFMPDPTAALREWARVLKPDGRLVMSTWTGGDPRWAWERELRMPFAARMDPGQLQELVAGLQSVNRFDAPEKVEAELAAAGLAVERAHVCEREFVFETEDDWWAWNWSHGTRAFLEALPDPVREEFRAEAYEAIQANRGDHGFPRRYTALFTSARPT